MGLFFDVLSSINNPGQQGSVSQLASITQSVQELASSRGVQPSTMQTVLSVLGNAISPALRQQQSVMGSNQLENLIGRSIGGGAVASVIQSLFPPQAQQQIIEGIAKKTGLSPNAIQGMLPTLIPLVLGLLSMGAKKPGVASAGNSSNSLLSAFLDGNQDGNTDLGDVFKFATRFLNAPGVA